MFLLPVTFRQIPFCGFRDKVENVSAYQRTGSNPGFPICPQNTKFYIGLCVLASYQILLKLRTAVSDEKSKMSQPIRARTAMIGMKNTNLVEDDVFMLPVKFRQIPLGGVREELENVKSKRLRKTDGRTTMITLLHLRLRLSFHW